MKTVNISNLTPENLEHVGLMLVRQLNDNLWDVSVKLTDVAAKITTDPPEAICSIIQGVLREGNLKPKPCFSLSLDSQMHSFTLSTNKRHFVVDPIPSTPSWNSLFERFVKLKNLAIQTQKDRIQLEQETAKEHQRKENFLLIVKELESIQGRP